MIIIDLTKEEGILINFTGKVIGYDGSTIEEILKDYYTKAETYSKKETYSKDETYSKEETYSKDETYSKVETYSKGETYSKEETDSIIPKFSGFIQGEIKLVTQTPADKRGEVMYSATLGRFVYKLGDTYYSSWFSIHNYMVIDTMRPIENRIFEYDKKQYLYNGSELIIINKLNSDYTTLTNKPMINGVPLVGDMTPAQLGIPASSFIAGRYWNEENSTPTAAGYYGSLDDLRSLPTKLGLGRYLVTDDRKRRKLHPHDSTRYEDGTPAALDGTQGQCMWCWNGFYANIWKEGNNLIKAVTNKYPVGDGVSIWVPAGGISWLGAGVMDRTNLKLCSLISDAEQYRGGTGKALNASSYANAPSADSPQITMLGMPATFINTTDFGYYARKRGEGWEANWFVARFVVEFLFEIIMGTENSQAAFNAEKDANGLYQGGFGMGVTNMTGWNGYNGYFPLIPTSVGLEAGDSVCLVPFSLPQTDGKEGEAYHTFNVPVFFGLVGAGFGNLFQWVRGLIMDAGDKSLVYVTPSMYADYNPNTVTDKILVAECPQVEGFIKRKSYQGLCCMPTEVGGSPTIRFADYFYTDVATSKGLRVRAVGDVANIGAFAGASCTYAGASCTYKLSNFSAPLCYFEEDPVIPETQRIG